MTFDAKVAELRGKNSVINSLEVKALDLLNKQPYIKK